MGPVATRRWLSIHRWSGLLVSLNVLVFALTGLVLIYHEEIDDLLGSQPRSVDRSPRRLPVAELVAVAGRDQPGAVPVFVFQQPEEQPGVVTIGMARGTRAFEGAVPVSVDGRTGQVLGNAPFEDTFTGVIYHLHAELLAGSTGRLLVGFLGLVFLLSIVSGAVVYGPMMKRFAYGLIRRDRKPRTWLADLHKLVGVSTLGWLFVVTVTGSLLSVSSMLLSYYSSTELAALARPYLADAPVDDLSTIDAAIDGAQAGQPGRTWSFVALPGSELSSPRHYTVLLLGGAGLEKRMFTMAMVDAKAPTTILHREMPWYLRVLLVSEPLHFGDYGGWPMRLLWTLFTLATLGLAATGVYVNLSTRRQRALRRRIEPLDEEAAT